MVKQCRCWFTQVHFINKGFAHAPPSTHIWILWGVQKAWPQLGQCGSLNFISNPVVSLKTVCYGHSRDCMAERSIRASPSCRCLAGGPWLCSSSSPASGHKTPTFHLQLSCCAFAVLLPSCTKGNFSLMLFSIKCYSEIISLLLFSN